MPDRLCPSCGRTMGDWHPLNAFHATITGNSFVSACGSCGALECRPRRDGEAWVPAMPPAPSIRESVPTTELTPIGEQYVIPGCEANRSPRAVQLGLFG